MKHVVFKTSGAATIQRGAMETETIQKNGASSKSLMSRKNFLVALCGVLLAAGAVFSGCDKDDDDKQAGTLVITAKVENGNDYNAVISTVEARCYEDGKGRGEYEVFASSSYANGGFTITLPATPNTKYLETLEDPPAGITVSDKTAKIMSVSMFMPLNSKGYRVGYLSYEKEDNNSWTWAEFWYADKDVTVSGSHEGVDEEDEEYSFSMSLKKGWNIVYVTETRTVEKYEYTTTPVSGLKWYFESDPTAGDYDQGMADGAALCNCLKAAGGNKAAEDACESNVDVSKIGNAYVSGLYESMMVGGCGSFIEGAAYEAARGVSAKAHKSSLKQLFSKK